MSLIVNFTNFHVFSDYITAADGGGFISNIVTNLCKYSKSCIKFFVSGAIYQANIGKRKLLQPRDVESVLHLAIGVESYAPLTVEDTNGSQPPANETSQPPANETSGKRGRPPPTPHKFDDIKKKKLAGNSVNYQTPYQC